MTRISLTQRTLASLVLFWALRTSTVAAYGPVLPDWHVAKLTVKNFPKEPSPHLTASHVAKGCLRSLQLVDYPSTDKGLDRIFPFLTYECRGHLTSSTTTSNADDKDDGRTLFRSRGALSPILQVFMGATNIHLGEDEATVSPGTLTRGDIVSYPVAVWGAEVLAFQHKSGLIRDRVSSGPPKTNMVIRLERARRPPTMGCWMIRDIVNVGFAKGGQGWSRDEGV